MKFFTADCHFSHKNIIKYCPQTRGKFIDHNGDPDTYTMNNEIVRIWNNTIHPEDIVYNIGDWSLNHNNRVKWGQKLNGEIRWVRGNHDSKVGKEGDIGKYLGKSSFLIEDGYLYMLIHSPYDIDSEVIFYNQMNLPIRVLCGHVHEKWQFKKVGEFFDDYITKEHQEKGCRVNYNTLNVGLDANNFELLSFDEVKKIFKENE